MTTALAPSRTLVLASMALLSAIWGTTWGAIRISLAGFPPLIGAGLRFLLAGIIVGVWATWRGRRLGGDPRLRWLWPIQAGLTFCLSYGIVYWAEQWVPSGLVSVLFATFPLFVAIYARWLLPAEHLGRLGLLGVLIGFAGVAVIFSEDLSRLGGRAVQTAAVITLVSPAAAAFANVAVKRWGAGLGPYALTAVPMAMAGGVLAIAGGVFERGREIVIAPQPVLAVVYLAVIGSAVTFTLYFWLLERIPATQLSVVAYAAPVIAVAVGMLAFDEPMTLRIGAGALLVVAGVGVVLRRH